MLYLVAQYLHSLMTLQQQQNNSANSSQERILNVAECLEALHNVIKNNPGVIHFSCFESVGTRKCN